MYDCYEFTFAGQPSELYGLHVCDIGSRKHGDNPFGNTASIVNTRLPRRVTPLHYGVRYNDSPLTFSLIFASERRLDRWEMQAVAQWLTGYQDYQWLTISQPDLEDVRFRCLVKTLTPVSVGWYPVAFEAQIECDCPYGYSYPVEREYTAKGTLQALLQIPSSAHEHFLPMLEIEMIGKSDLKIENAANGRVTQFTGLPSDVKFTMDNENQILTAEAGEYNLYDFFNFVFFALEPGDNDLTITGNCKIRLSGMYFVNVGA